MLLVPPFDEWVSRIGDDDRVGTAHQPGFFNAGVALKFQLLDALPRGAKTRIFIDTDRAVVALKVPRGGGPPERMALLESDAILRDLLAPPDAAVRDFFDRLEGALARSGIPGAAGCIPRVREFGAILRRRGGGLLKDALAGAFLEYAGLPGDYVHLSNLLRGEPYRAFVLRIFDDDARFRDIFNTALGEFREEFRFRWRRYPFPPLGEGELPFWVVRGGRRERCFKGAADPSSDDIIPRAVTLTLFLRLHLLDFFIHGVGGANYEWIGDRLIERFFLERPPPYAAASRTRLLDGSPERDLPFFYFDRGSLRPEVERPGPEER